MIRLLNSSFPGNFFYMDDVGRYSNSTGVGLQIFQQKRHKTSRWVLLFIRFCSFNSHATLSFNTELQLRGLRSCFRHKLASKTLVISLNADKMINFMSEQNWQASFKLQNIENTQIFKAGENIKLNIFFFIHRFLNPRARFGQNFGDQLIGHYARRS